MGLSYEHGGVVYEAESARAATEMCDYLGAIAAKDQARAERIAAVQARAQERRLAQERQEKEDAQAAEAAAAAETARAAQAAEAARVKVEQARQERQRQATREELDAVEKSLEGGHHAPHAELAPETPVEAPVLEQQKPSIVEDTSRREAQIIEAQSDLVAVQATNEQQDKSILDEAIHAELAVAEPTMDVVEEVKSNPSPHLSEDKSTPEPLRILPEMPRPDNHHESTITIIDQPDNPPTAKLQMIDVPALVDSTPPTPIIAEYHMVPSLEIINEPIVETVDIADHSENPDELAVVEVPHAMMQETDDLIEESAQGLHVQSIEIPTVDQAFKPEDVDYSVVDSDDEEFTIPQAVEVLVVDAESNQDPAIQGELTITQPPQDHEIVKELFTKVETAVEEVSLDKVSAIQDLADKVVDILAEVDVADLNSANSAESVVEREELTEVISELLDVLGVEADSEEKRQLVSLLIEHKLVLNELIEATPRSGEKGTREVLSHVTTLMSGLRQSLEPVQSLIGRVILYAAQTRHGLQPNYGLST